jgi:uncharacterized delta-60 repeat protein
MRKLFLIVCLLLPCAALAAPGDLDTAFGANGRVVTETGVAAQGIALQPDGKILVAGSNNGSPGRILARYRVDGSLDPQFGTNGIVTMAVPSVGSAIAVHPNGRILVLYGIGGTSGEITGFLPDGRLDPGFGVSGRIVFVGGSLLYPSDIAVQADGRIVASAICRTNDVSRLCAFRFLADGSPDPSFGSAGVAMSETVDSGGVMALLPEGRMLLGGTVLTIYSPGATRYVRLNADGSPAGSFAGPGEKFTPVYTAAPTRLLPLADGRFIASGVTSGYGNPIVGPPYGWLTRHLADGAQDGSFGTNGWVTWGSSAYGALQPDGKILAMGAASSAGGVARFLANGAPDGTFGSGGSVTDATVAGWGRGVVQPDGKLVVVANMASNFTLTRYRLAADAAFDAPQGDADGDGIPNGVEFMAGRDPSVKDNDVFADARLFAMQQYRDFLAREGDAGGVDFWTSQLSGAAQTRAQMAEAFFNSAEFQDTRAPIVRLYFAYFLRIPDYDGLQYWMGRYRTGESIEAISDLFAASPEFGARYGNLDNAGFVDRVYRNVLGRAPDANGLAYWKGRLDAGMTRGQVMVAFSESPEYRALIANEVYVTMMYVGMLRRAPDAGGFSSWVGYLDGGNSGLALTGAFIASAEYRARFLP